MTPTKTIPLWVRDADGVAFADVPTVPGGRMPDFCIIGSAKCGTTSLDRYLGTHPRIFVNALKEPHYFSTEEIWSRGADWYTGLYAEATPDQLCGEASTSYTRTPMAEISAKRLHDANPEMKLIYILREPVNRVQSEALQTQKYMKNVLYIDTTDMTLDAFLDMVEDPASEFYSAIVDTSKYEAQLAPYEALFRPDQILLLTQSALRDDPVGTVHKVHDFLGLPRDTSFDGSAHANTAAAFFDGQKQVRVTSKLRKIPGYAVLKGLVPQGLKAKIVDALDEGPTPEANRKLSAARHAAIKAELDPHTTVMETRLGLPASEW